MNNIKILPKIFRNFKNLPRFQPVRHEHREEFVQGDAQKTTVTVLNKELENTLMIDSYSNLGFTLNNGMRVVGPMAIFPNSVLCWNIGSSKDINPESLALFHTIEPKIDVLVLGYGDSKSKIDPKIFHFLRQKRIAIEAMPTDKACAIFNFLNAEGRFVAAGMIPPVQYSVSDQDVVDSKARYESLYKYEGETTDPKVDAMNKKIMDG